MPLRIIDLNSIGTNLVPTSNVTYDLGTANNAWKDLFLSGNTISLGGASISTDDSTGAVTIVPKVTEANPNPKATLIKADGVASVNTSGGVVSSNSIASASAGGSSITVYATIAELPLSGNDAGAMAFVSATNRLYIWNGSGWFNIALLNQSPTITSGPNASYELASDGTPLVLTLTAQDPEGVPLTWSYSVTSGTLGSTVVSQANNVFTITPSTNIADAGVFSITFTASDGINLATAASTFTLVFSTADDYYNLNSTLIKTGSTAGLNNITFVDESTNGFTVTATGDVYQGSYSPYSPAGWSGYFDGVGDYITAPISTIGTGNFTIECWIYPISFGSFGGVFTLAGISSPVGVTVCVDQWWVGTAGSVNTFVTGNKFTLNAWQHVAVVRSGSTITGYVNGISVGSATNSTNITATGVVAASRYVDDYSYLTHAYISDLRVVNGTAVYTSNFTPPTEKLTAISGTSQLTLQDNRFVDNSTNNFAITRNGDVKVVPNSPYLPSTEYNPAIHGGSMYFDNTGDELSILNDAGFQFGTGDFTIELWVYYASSADVNGTLIGLNTASVGNWAIIGSSGVLYFQNGNASSSLMYPYTPPFGQWAHIAWTRESGINRAFINGVKVSGDVSNATNYNGTGTLTIGNGITYGTHQGYIADVRVVKGTAVYTSNFTPPTQSLTAISGTSLLIRGANAGVYDEMGKNNVKSFGDATTSTSVTKYNTTSMYFDGNGDYLEIADDPALQLGTGDFTIEAWVYPTAWNNTTLQSIISKRSGASNYWRIGSSGSAGDLSFRHSEMTVSLQANGALTLNQWTHVAVIRINSVFYLFVDGQQAHTTSNGGTNDISYSGVPVRIGRAAPSETYYWPGYVEDVRITKGHARYTASFTPPTEPLGFSNAE